MLVITNRALSSKLQATGVDSDKAFGEKQNSLGINEIRLAHAYRKNKKWEVKLVPEPDEKERTDANLPSRVEFNKTIARCKENGRDCLIYVHGFGKSFKEALEQAEYIEKCYNVEVVMFTWPTNPGGFVTMEYRDVKRIALASTGAFDRVMERIGKYLSEPGFDRSSLLSCGVHLNLMTYSMGNFLLQHYVLSDYYGRETDMFTNVILCQADCDNVGHEAWLHKLIAGQRIYVTINEKDKILGWSEAQNQRDRLGRTARNLIASNTIYVDFTGGENVGNTHQLWGEVDHDTVINFFSACFKGERAEELSGFSYDSRMNAYRIQRDTKKVKQ